MTVFDSAKARKVELDAGVSDLLLKMRNCMESLDRELKRREKVYRAQEEELESLRELVKGMP